MQRFPPPPSERWQVHHHNIKLLQNNEICKYGGFLKHVWYRIDPWMTCQYSVLLFCTNLVLKKPLKFLFYSTSKKMFGLFGTCRHVGFSQLWGWLIKGMTHLCGKNWVAFTYLQNSSSGKVMFWSTYQGGLKMLDCYVEPGHYYFKPDGTLCSDSRNQVGVWIFLVNKYCQHMEWITKQP